MHLHMFLLHVKMIKPVRMSVSTPEVSALQASPSENKLCDDSESSIEFSFRPKGPPRPTLGSLRRTWKHPQRIFSILSANKVKSLRVDFLTATRSRPEWLKSQYSNLEDTGGGYKNAYSRCNRGIDVRAMESASDQDQVRVSTVGP